MQVSPLEVASDVLFGQVDASGLPSGHLGQSRSARSIMVGNAGRVGEGLNWLTYPSGCLDKDRARQSLPQSFLILWGETDDATWARSDQEAHFSLI